MNSKWEILREQFLAELFSTKITLKSWCEKMDISYHSARRYIKVGEEKKLHHMRKNNNAQLQKSTFNNDTEINDIHKNQPVRLGGRRGDINKDLNEMSPTKKRILFNKDQQKFIIENNLEFVKSYEDAMQYKLTLLGLIYKAEQKIIVIRLNQFSLMSEIGQLTSAFNSERSSQKSLLITEKILNIHEDLDLESVLSFSLSNFMGEQVNKILDLQLLTNWMIDTQVN
ncbi:MAG: hypothetical protein ACJAS1_002643 [Oleiphilaceae bacterium]|jgi:hypothetical protein